MTSPSSHALPLVATACLLLLAACGGESTADGPPSKAESDPLADRPPLVRVAPVEKRPVRREIETTGYLESEHSVTVLPEVAARVVEVLVDEGSSVQAGQILARLDDREAKTAVRQVEIQIQDQRLRIELAGVEREASARRLAQATIERDQAKALHDRNLSIDPGLISAQELEDSSFALQRAEEAVMVSELDASKVELEIKQADNRLAELESQLEAAELRFQQHAIRAPIDGVVVERMIRGGETVGTTTELFRVVDQEHLIAYLRRPQRELALVRDAEHVLFTTDAVPGTTFHADIDVVSAVVDQTTGTFRMRMRVRRDAEEAELLRPGMFMRARILTDDERDALMVPKAAVLNEGSQSVVFAVRDGVAERIVLLPGIEERDHVESLDSGEDGLRADDLVVVSGQDSLRDRTAVEVAHE